MNSKRLSIVINLLIVSLVIWERRVSDGQMGRINGRDHPGRGDNAVLERQRTQSKVSKFR